METRMVIILTTITTFTWTKGMAEPEIDTWEEEALLEIASNFKDWEQDTLLKQLAGEGQTGNPLRARKVLFQKAILSLKSKGLVNFWKSTNTLAALFAPTNSGNSYVGVTQEGRKIAEQLAQQNIDSKDNNLQILTQ